MHNKLLAILDWIMQKTFFFIVSFLFFIIGNCQNLDLTVKNYC